MGVGCAVEDMAGDLGIWGFGAGRVAAERGLVSVASTVSHLKHLRLRNNRTI